MNKILKYFSDYYTIHPLTDCERFVRGEKLKDILE